MNKKRILIVDDDPDQRLVIRLPLEAAGYEVVEAINSEEGRKLVLETRPDLIILDVMMDSTTAGFQLAIELHNRADDSEFKEIRNIPILMLTAIHSTTPLRFAPDEDYLPVQTFLEKPVDPELLLAKVHGFIG